MSQTTRAAYRKVAEYLRRVIPPPPPPMRKAQKSFATLSEAQHLTNNTDEMIGGRDIPAGSRWEVTRPSNLGVVLWYTEDPAITINLNTKEWKDRFTRVRRPPKKRAKKK